MEFTHEVGNRDESVSSYGVVSCDIQVVVGGESFAVYFHIVLK